MQVYSCLEITKISYYTGENSRTHIKHTLVKLYNCDHLEDGKFIIIISEKLQSRSHNSIFDVRGQKLLRLSFTDKYDRTKKSAVFVRLSETSNRASNFIFQEVLELNILFKKMLLEITRFSDNCYHFEGSLGVFALSTVLKYIFQID